MERKGTPKRPRALYDEAAEKQKDKEYAGEEMRKRTKVFADRSYEELMRARNENYPDGSKFCTYCQGEQTLDHWSLVKTRPDTFGDRCKIDLADRRKEKKDQLAPRLPSPPQVSLEVLALRKTKYPNGLKRCVPCNGDYPFDHFSNNASNKCGLGYCKLRLKTLKLENRKAKLIGTFVPVVKMRSTKVGEEICCSCREQKPLNQFPPHAIKNLSKANVDVKSVKAEANEVDISDSQGEKKKKKKNYGLQCSECEKERYKGYRCRFEQLTLKLKTECGKCENCGYSNIDGLELVYRAGSPRRRNKNGSTMIPSNFWCWTREKFLNEFKLMKIICRCCAQEERLVTRVNNRTKPRDRSQLMRQNFVEQTKLAIAKCCDCEKKVELHNLGSFEFDHLLTEDGCADNDFNVYENVEDAKEEKQDRKKHKTVPRITVAYLTSSAARFSLDKIKEEMDKCVLRCCNCRLISYKKQLAAKRILSQEIKLTKSLTDLVCVYFQ